MKQQKSSLVNNPEKKEKDHGERRRCGWRGNDGRSRGRRRGITDRDRMLILKPPSVVECLELARQKRGQSIYFGYK
jgi:hypothetical protein